MREFLFDFRNLQLSRRGNGDSIEQNECLLHNFGHWEGIRAAGSGREKAIVRWRGPDGCSDGRIPSNGTP